MRVQLDILYQCVYIHVCDFSLKSYNNWVKSVLIDQFLCDNASVLDICCGKVCYYACIACFVFIDLFYYNVPSFLLFILFCCCFSVVYTLFLHC